MSLPSSSLSYDLLTSYSFRDHLTFRFRGVRFAPQPTRFTYPTMYNGSGEVVPALSYGPACTQFSGVQAGGGSEDCLFLNIWTPSLPSPKNAQEAKKLKPVLFWVFGGGFAENSAADPNFDGGNMASRGDVVMVAVNYRLGTFGFLALDNGVTNGNYGLADQILGLDWVRKHIQDYGGDPEHITLVGQSSGGASVRALMASPLTSGKYVGALPMSVPGRKGFAEYYTIDELVETTSNNILNATNCIQNPSPVDCLREVNATTLIDTGIIANSLVVDGTYLTTAHLPLNKGTKAPYRFMTGLPREDGAPFLMFPPNLTAEDQDQWLASQNLPIPPSSLFPRPDIQNETLAVYSVGARIGTDQGFRCLHEATVYAGLHNRVWDEIYFFEFDRTYQTPDWPLSDLCEAPRSPEHPLGDPNAEFDNFHCHSGQLLFVFGNIKRFGLPYRDEKGDEEFEKEILDRWASFVRGGSPNIKGASEWKPATTQKMQMAALQWPEISMIDFRDLEQCAWLGQPLDYLA